MRVVVQLTKELVECGQLAASFSLRCTLKYRLRKPCARDVCACFLKKSSIKVRNTSFRLVSLETIGFARTVKEWT